MAEMDWLETGRPFLQSVATWFNALPTVQMKGLFLSPARVAVFAVDMQVGFCSSGVLAGIVRPVVNLLQRAYALGVRYFLLPQERFVPGASPYGPFAAHALTEANGAAMVPDLSGLPFAHLLQVIPKSSPQPAFGTSLDEWVDVHPGVNTYFVVGNCTDLSLYQLAVYLKFRALSRQIQRRVIVPADCAATYDLPPERAGELGTLPHDGELLDRLFLYHMAGSGVEVVRAVV